MLPLDWSLDGHNLLYLAEPDLWVYYFADGTSHLFLKAKASLNNAEFSPDGKWLATGYLDDAVVNLWDVETGKEVWRTFTVPAPEPV